MNIINKRSVILGAMLVLFGVGAANAGPFRGRVIIAPEFRHHYGFFGPAWSPYWGPYDPYFVGAPYVVSPPKSDVKVEVTPKQTQVFVDGSYAGVADDFNGAFHHLSTTPGDHTIALALDGYRTVTERIYARPESTFKLRETMERLAPGEVSAPVPSK